MPRRLAEPLFALGVALWLGARLMSGLAAATIFPRLERLDPSLPAFADYTGDHARLLGGMLASAIFVRADAVALLGALLAVVGLALAHRKAPRSTAGSIRLAATAAALLLFAIQYIALDPRMDAHLTAYWDAAAAGDTPTAEHHRAAFGRLHPASSALMAATICTLAVALVAGSCHAASPSPRA